MADWYSRFRGLAKLIGSWSKDRSTHVGCIVFGPDREVRTVGYNGFPRGVNDDVEERHARPAKYLWTEHAERNAIYNAALTGVCLKGCTLVAAGLYPCADCARAIIQSGIVRLVADVPNFDHPVWGESWRVADIMLREANVVQDLY